MKKKHVPLRKCVVCQKMLAKKELVRIVRTPEGRVELDPTGKKNGRGAYVCGRMEGFERAKKQKAFERALGVALTQEDYARLEQELAAIAPKFAGVICEREREGSP